MASPPTPSDFKGQWHEGTVVPSGPLPALLPPEGCGETGWCLTPSDGHQIIKEVCVPCPASGPGLFSLGALAGEGRFS